MMTFEESSSRTRGLRLQTLVACAGSRSRPDGSGARVYVVLGFDLPLGWCLAAIALCAWLNIFLTLALASTICLTDRNAALLLGYDILQLAAPPLSHRRPGESLRLPLPRAGYRLGDVAAAQMDAGRLAPRLSLRQPPRLRSPAAAVVRRASLSACLRIYFVGMWTALVSGVVFSAIYARRIAEEARQMSAALAATELVLAREQRLSALDGLAAAAAHELGTPLATIALVAKELKRELPHRRPTGEDIDLLISQAARCREILSRLANRDTPADAILAQAQAARSCSRTSSRRCAGRM